MVEGKKSRSVFITDGEISTINQLKRAEVEPQTAFCWGRNAAEKKGKDLIVERKRRRKNLYRVAPAGRGSQRIHFQRGGRSNKKIGMVPRGNDGDEGGKECFDLIAQEHFFLRKPPRKGVAVGLH